MSDEGELLCLWRDEDGRVVRMSRFPLGVPTPVEPGWLRTDAVAMPDGVYVRDVNTDGTASVPDPHGPSEWF